MIAEWIARMNAWLARRMGLTEITEPVILQDGEQWLRLAPGEQPRWFLSPHEAAEFRAANIWRAPNDR